LAKLTAAFAAERAACRCGTATDEFGRGLCTSITPPKKGKERLNFGTWFLLFYTVSYRGLLYFL
jgi:hypothetical protein